MEQRGPETQKPITETFNSRIKQAIEAKPYQSAVDQGILVDLVQGIPESYDIIYGIDKIPLWGISKRIQDNLNKYKDNPAPEKIRDHGVVIQEMAIYIAHQVDDGAISLGINTAKTLSEQLFNYGESLIDGKENTKPTTFNDIARIEKLSQSQTQTIDHLLGIDKLFQPPTRLTGDIKSQRRQILSNFFFDVGRTAAPLLEPTSTYTEQITKSIETAITMPVRELEKSIVHRKMEILSREKPLNLGTISQTIANFFRKDTRLYQGLKLATDKQQLKNLRNNPNSTVEEISLLEQQIAQKIQITIASITRQEKAEARDIDTPYKPNDKVHHTLAVNLGSTLLQQAGITDYLIGNTPDTSALFLITADSKVIMLGMDNPNPLRTYNITESTKESALFSQLPQPEGLKIKLGSNDILPRRWRNLDVTLYQPEDGQRMLTLFDMALDYHKRTSYPFRRNEVAPEKRLNNYQKSLRIFEKITSPSLQDENIWENYIQTLLKCANDADIGIADKERKTLRQKAAQIFNRKNIA